MANPDHIMAALEAYTGLGWHLFPVVPLDRTPLLKNGCTARQTICGYFANGGASGLRLTQRSTAANRALPQLISIQEMRERLRLLRSLRRA